MLQDDGPDDVPLWVVFLPLVPFCLFLLMLGRGVEQPIDVGAVVMCVVTWLRQQAAIRGWTRDRERRETRG